MERGARVPDDDGHSMPVAAQYGALAVTWGASFLLIKIGLEGLSPGQVVVSRLVTGAVALIAACGVRRARAPRDPVAWAHLAVAAVLLCDVPFLLFAWAEQHISSSLASVYNAATPLMTALWGLALLPGERPTRARTTGLVTGFAGVVLVLGPWRQAGGTQSLAQLACLAATMCYGAGFTYLRRQVAPRGIGALPAATVQVALAAAIALILAPWTATAPVRLSPAVVGSALVLGALGTGIAYVWNTAVVASWGATIASTVTYVVPVVGVILGVLVLSETLTWNEPAGAVIVVLGILIAQDRLAGLGRHLRHPARREGSGEDPRTAPVVVTGATGRAQAEEDAARGRLCALPYPAVAQRRCTGTTYNVLINSYSGSPIRYINCCFAFVNHLSRAQMQ
jgi:drug/metabolite transporter (DMT)-like permease